MSNVRPSIRVDPQKLRDVIEQLPGARVEKIAEGYVLLRADGTVIKDGFDHAPEAWRWLDQNPEAAL